LRPQEAIVLETLRRDESLQFDEILELLETQLTSSELFTALFEFKITGRIGQLPGKNYVRTMRENSALCNMLQAAWSAGDGRFHFRGRGRGQ
jgi:hypothetical protein